MTAFAADFQQRLWRFVRHRVPADADADDVVQDVLLKLWQHRDRVDDTAVAAWLFQVARTAIADFHRARGRAPASLAADFDAPERGAEPQRELAGCLLPLLEELPDADRAVLRRVDLDGGAQTELARDLALSVSGAKSRVQRARERLHRALVDCCRIELDRLGLPLDDYQCRSDGACNAASQLDGAAEPRDRASSRTEPC